MTLHSQLIASMGNPAAARAWRFAITFHESLERSRDREKLARDVWRLQAGHIVEIRQFARAQAAAARYALELADDEAERANYWLRSFLVNFGMLLIAEWARVLSVLP